MARPFLPGTAHSPNDIQMVGGETDSTGGPDRLARRFYELALRDWHSARPVDHPGSEHLWRLKRLPSNCFPSRRPVLAALNPARPSIVRVSVTSLLSGAGDGCPDLARVFP